MFPTRWHITFGTYGCRLHGGFRATVDRKHNTRGEEYVGEAPRREAFERSALTGEPVFLTTEQQLFVQSVVPGLCERGGWSLVECSAASDHVHVILDADPSIHGRRIRPLLKRWLSQALNERWPGTRRSDGMTWWAEGGSN